MQRFEVDEVVGLHRSVFCRSFGTLPPPRRWPSCSLTLSSPCSLADVRFQDEAVPAAARCGYFHFSCTSRTASAGLCHSDNRCPQLVIGNIIVWEVILHFLPRDLAVVVRSASATSIIFCRISASTPLRALLCFLGPSVPLRFHGLDGWLNPRQPDVSFPDGGNASSHASVTAPCANVSPRAGPSGRLQAVQRMLMGIMQKG